MFCASTGTFEVGFVGSIGEGAASVSEGPAFPRALDGWACFTTAGGIAAAHTSGNPCERAMTVNEPEESVPFRSQREQRCCVVYNVPASLPTQTGIKHTYWKKHKE